MLYHHTIANSLTFHICKLLLLATSLLLLFIPNEILLFKILFIWKEPSLLFVIVSFDLLILFFLHKSVKIQLIIRSWKRSKESLTKYANLISVLLNTITNLSNLNNDTKKLVFESLTKEFGVGELESLKNLNVTKGTFESLKPDLLAFIRDKTNNLPTELSDKLKKLPKDSSPNSRNRSRSITSRHSFFHKKLQQFTEVINK